VRDGVCNKHGQTFGVPKLLISDGSQFTTSAAENPTLIIVTLAIRQSDYIADQMKRRISRKQWLAKRSKRPKRPAGTAARRFLLQCQELSMCRIYAQTDPILYECRARSVRKSGVTTTIRLENRFWQTLCRLAADNDMTTNRLIAKSHEELTQHLGETTNFCVVRARHLSSISRAESECIDGFSQPCGSGDG
jgi:predicted DNA-binding ribbon-helix-helix protein